MPSTNTARSEIEARIETLNSQRDRTRDELEKSRKFGEKCHADIAKFDGLIRDWEQILELIDAK